MGLSITAFQAEEINHDWRDDAACREAPKEHFFPERGGMGWVVHADQVWKKYCQRCPVWEECFIYSTKGSPNTEGEQYGVWAGLSPTLRRKFRDDIDTARKVASGEFNIYGQDKGGNNEKG